MDRRTFLGVTSAATLASTKVFANVANADFKTRWVVRGSEGFDALSFLGPLSGDPFYLKYYERDVAAFSARMPADAMATLRALKARTKAADILLSPFLDVRFSAGPDATLDDLLRSIDNAETALRPRFAASPYWDAATGESDWGQFLAAMPALRSLLVALRDAGFAAFRAERFDPKAMTKVPQLRARLAKFDVISEVERFTGRVLDPNVEVILLEYCKPHGIKIIGQRFLSAIDWSDEVVIRTAGHELLHPPVDPGGLASMAALAVLKRDPLLDRIVKEHDRAFGYNSLDGLLDEDLASALDQIIGERLGVARDPADRWTKVDGGMHVLAAGLYGLMHRTGYAGRGGDLEKWLRTMALGGWLGPSSLHGAASQVLRRPVAQLWPVPKKPD